MNLYTQIIHLFYTLLKHMFMDFFKNFNLKDDGVFISTFFNDVQHMHDEKSFDVSHSRAVVNRDRQAAHDLLVRDYFADNCLYNDDSFKRRFRLNKVVFLRISNALEVHYDYLKKKLMLEEE